MVYMYVSYLTVPTCKRYCGRDKDGFSDICRTLGHLAIWQERKAVTLGIILYTIMIAYYNIQEILLKMLVTTSNRKVINPFVVLLGVFLHRIFGEIKSCSPGRG